MFDDLTWRDMLCEGREDGQVDLSSEDPVSEDELPPFPKTRAECMSSSRPCTFFRCRHNLVLDVRQNGQIFVHNLGVDKPSCALDVIDDHGSLHPEQIDDLLGHDRPLTWHILYNAQRKIRTRVKENEPIATRYKQHSDNPEGDSGSKGMPCKVAGFYPDEGEVGWDDGGWRIARSPGAD